MLATSASEASRRGRQAFLLGWSFDRPGGVNEVVRNLVREFSNRGDLAPLVMEVIGSVWAETNAQDVSVLRVPLPSPYDRHCPYRALLRLCLRLPMLLWRLHSICDRFQIEVLNPHFIGLEYFALMLFRRSGLFRGKLLLSFHGSDIRGMVQTKGFEHYLSRLLLRGADLLIPCSEELGEEILMLVPECAGRKRIVTIGAFEVKKGHDVLLQAFARLHRSQKNVCLIIAGQTAARLESTRLLIRELGLQDDVLLLPDIPHASVAALLQLSDIFVLSSRWSKGIYGEGFAMALLEAGAAQKPVISTRTCGVAELIEDGESGIIVEPDRPELLAEAIESLLNDPGKAARLGQKLHEVIRRNFTWRAAHSQYLSLVSLSAALQPESEPAAETFVIEREPADL